MPLPGPFPSPEVTTIWFLKPQAAFVCSWSSQKQNVKVWTLLCLFSFAAYYICGIYSCCYMQKIVLLALYYSTVIVHSICLFTWAVSSILPSQMSTLALVSWRTSMLTWWMTQGKNAWGIWDLDVYLQMVLSRFFYFYQVYMRPKFL